MLSTFSETDNLYFNCRTCGYKHCIVHIKNTVIENNYMHRSCNACGRNLDDVFIKAIDDYNNKLSMAYNPFEFGSENYYDYNTRLKYGNNYIQAMTPTNTITNKINTSNNTINNNTIIKSNNKLNKKRLLLV